MVNFFSLVSTIGCIVLLYSHSLKAQEVRFSQFNAAPVQLNPATPGTVANTTLGLNYRIQQFGIIAYKTGYFSALIPVYSQQDNYEDLPTGGVGIGVMSDLAGEQNEFHTNQIDVGASYNLRLNRAQTHYLSLGIQASFQRTNVDYGVLTWPSQINYRGFDGPSPPSGAYASSVEALRFNTGIIWNYDPMRNSWKRLSRYRLHLGASLSNLNEPDYSFFQDQSNLLPRVYKFHGGGQFHFNERWSLSPGFFIIKQGIQIQYAGGSMVGIHIPPNTPSQPTDFRLLLGSWYRYRDAIVLLIGASSSQFDAALSYDVNASYDVRNIKRNNALELSLTYRFLNRRTPDIHPTPLF